MIIASSTVVLTSTWYWYDVCTEYYIRLKQVLVHVLETGVCIVLRKQSVGTWSLVQVPGTRSTSILCKFRGLDSGIWHGRHEYKIRPMAK